MEMSLAFPSSNTGGDVSDSGLPSTVEPPHLCCSSFWTWSSHDMEEEWPISMASLKAVRPQLLVCQLLSLLYPVRVEEVWAIFDPGGLTGHEETCPLAAGIHLSLYYSCTTPYISPSSGFTMRSTSLFCHLGPSLIPAPGSFCQDCGRGFSGPPEAIWVCLCSSSPSVSPLFILGPTFNPFKERSTDECDVFANPIIQNLSPPVQAHCGAQEVRGV